MVAPLVERWVGDQDRLILDRRSLFLFLLGVEIHPMIPVIIQAVHQVQSAILLFLTVVQVAIQGLRPLL